MSKTRKTRLRGFKVSNNSQLTKNFNLLNNLIAKIDQTATKDRWLKLSQSDDDVEFISYSKKDKDALFGIILRMSLTSDTIHIKDSLFEEKNFTLDQMSVLNTEFDKLYLSHYYFYVTDKKLVVNIPGNTSIKGFQTYVNWFLEMESTPYEFTPAVKNTENIKISDIKEVRFGGNSITPEKMNDPDTDSVDNRSVSIWGLEMIKDILKSSSAMSDDDLNQIISATLNVKLKKPKGKSDEEYQQHFGAILKPISDLEDISFITRKGDTINSKNILYTDSVTIDLTKNGHFVDEQIRQAMIKFISGF